jgi:hypothetical protein
VQQKEAEKWDISFLYTYKKLLRNRDDDDDGNGDHPKLAEEYYCAGVTPRFLYFFFVKFCLQHE